MRRMRIACWIPKATKTHSEYATFIDFPLQQWLFQRAPMLRYSTLSVLFTPTKLRLYSWLLLSATATKRRIRTEILGFEFDMYGV